MQERVRAHIEDQHVALAAYVQLAQSLDRRFRLALRGTKRAEVMRTEQALRGFVHRRQIQRRVEPADLARLYRRTSPAIDQEIPVAASLCREARVKFFRHRMRPAHGNAAG